MKLRNIVAAALAVAALAVAPAASFAGTTRSIPTVKTTAAVKVTDSKVKAVIKETNAVRKANGAGALKENKDLNKAAQVRLNEIIKSGKFAHVRPDGSKYSTVVTGILTGENLTRFSGYSEAPEVVAVRNWVNSESHFKNMIEPRYTQIGVAFAQAPDGTWYSCQVFGAPGTVAKVDTERA